MPVSFKSQSKVYRTFVERLLAFLCVIIAQETSGSNMAISKLSLKVSTTAVVMFLAAILSNPDYILNTFGGRQEHALKTRWADHGGFNNERCWKNTGDLTSFDLFKIEFNSSTP